MGKIGIIARREFNERVKKKSFIITTILMPVFFVAMMFVPMLMMKWGGDKVREVAVVDRSGVVAQHLQDEKLLKFQISDLDYEQVREEKPEGIFGILVIGEDIMTNSRDVQLDTYESSTVFVEESIADQIGRIVEEEKLKSYNIENLAQIMDEVKTNVVIQTKEIMASGEARESSSILSTVAAYLFGFLIYMFVFLYGNMVMQGVIEEKSTKVLELMVSSVKPFQLMMGKILGIASVAITQLAIWVVFIIVIGGGAMSLFAGDMMESAAAMNSGGMAGVDVESMASGLSADQAVIISKITDVKYILTMLIGFIIYFVGGYLLYAAMFAAVGSSVDNEKDTQNLQLPITIPLILAIFIMISVMQEPHSSLAVWFSMIPFTSPVVMMARLPHAHGVPGWELALSIGLLFLTFLATVWLAGKIYRVGIFMHGKKPTFKEIGKWIRYKS